MPKKVTLRFCATRYGRTTFREIELFYRDWKPVVMRWLWPALEWFENITELDAPHVTMWDVLSSGLPGLAEVPSWEAFTRIPIPKLEMEDVRDLYMDIDDAFHRLWGADRGALRSGRVRKFLSDYLLEMRPDGVVVRANMGFSPKGRANHTPRPLISDQVRYDEGKAEPPLGALPHANPAELKALQSNRLRADLEAISDACCREIAAYYEACAIQDSILAKDWNPALAYAVLRGLPKSGVPKHMQALGSEERSALIAHYIKVESNPTTPFKGGGYKGGSTLGLELARRMGIEPLDFQRCLRYRHYPHQTVLIAAIILLQIATAWNVSSVMELKKDDIRPLPEGGYIVQSIKARTGDDTPMVLIDGNDSPAARALRFALERLAGLQVRGWAESSEQCLWLSSESNYDSCRGLAISALTQNLRKLREKYSLPYFTFEMLRVQKLTLVSIDQGPIAAAEMAGHSTYGTISSYIDHLLTRRVNSSINLEFQRRWEKEVASRIEMVPLGVPLMPIGDGASCLNSSTPPHDAWLSGGICSGAHCHAGSGCENRKLSIDRNRVEEAILTSRYYNANWNRLYAENPEAFAAIHMPRLEFNMYLIEYLKKGPYRHLING